MSREQKNNGWLQTGEAIQFLKENGKEITRQGLRNIGRIRGFIRKAKDKFHYEFSVVGLNKYLETLFAPDGYMKVSEISEKYNLPIHKIYYYMKLHGLGESFNGIKYVKEDDVEKFINSSKG